MNAHIYTLTDPTTGNVRYVGCTIDPKRRKKQYQRGQRSQNVAKWMDSLEKLGHEPIFAVVETCKESESRARELHWINKYKETGLLLNKNGVTRSYGPLDSGYGIQWRKFFVKD